MAITAIRTVLIYILIIAAMRIMGKRQLGELQPVELVVTLLISDMAAVPMQESGIPLLSGVLPILILVALELLLSGLMLKSPFFSRLISGNPIVLVREGELQQSALKKMRMTVGLGSCGTCFCVLAVILRSCGGFLCPLFSFFRVQGFMCIMFSGSR